MIGKFRHRITFISEGEHTDYAGGYIPMDNEVLSTYANVERLKNNQYITEGMEDFSVNYRVRIHHRSNFTVDPKFLVLFRGSKHRIISEPVQENIDIDKIIQFDIAKL